MLPLTSTVESGEYERKLRELQRLTRRSWPEILRREARLMAVSLMRSTQPYGDDATARSVGEKAVARDISRVYGTLSDGFASIAATEDGQLADAFYYFGEIGQVSVAQKILESSQADLRNVPIGRLDPALHQGRRDQRGRIPRAAKILQLIRDPRAIAAYTRRRQRYVGTAKSGWAACARILGGTSGIPGWVTRNAGRGGVMDRSGVEGAPAITISNQVSYIDKAFNRAEAGNAFAIGRRRLIRQVEFALRANARKVRLAA